LSMGACDGPHGFGRGIIVQEDPAAAIHLEIDEAWCEESARRQALRPRVARNIFAAGDAGEEATFHDNRGFVVPAAAIENAVGKNGLLFVIQRCSIRTSP